MSERMPEREELRGIGDVFYESSSSTEIKINPVVVTAIFVPVMADPTVARGEVEVRDGDCVIARITNVGGG